MKKVTAIMIMVMTITFFGSLRAEIVPTEVVNNAAESQGLYAALMGRPEIKIIPDASRVLGRTSSFEGVEKGLFQASLVSLMALNVADYLSTKEALRYPGLQEGNPVMKPFVKNDFTFIAVKAGFSALSYMSLKSVYKKDKRLGWVLSTLSNVALGYVVANDMSLIQKAKAAGR